MSHIHFLGEFDPVHTATGFKVVGIVEMRGESNKIFIHYFFLLKCPSDVSTKPNVPHTRCHVADRGR